MFAGCLVHTYELLEIKTGRLSLRVALIQLSATSRYIQSTVSFNAMAMGLDKCTLPSVERSIAH